LIFIIVSESPIGLVLTFGSFVFNIFNLINEVWLWCFFK